MYKNYLIEGSEKLSAMMDPEESDMEEMSTISKFTFDSGQSSPVAALGGWASGAGNALFAVTKV